MDIIKITESFDAATVLEAARAHYLTGPRPNILQYPSDYAEAYATRDAEGFPMEEGYWVPMVYGTDKGYVAQCELPYLSTVKHIGIFPTLAEAAFAAHDYAWGEQQLDEGDREFAED